MRIVGRDIAPGAYRSVGGGFCYWERLRGFGGKDIAPGAWQSSGGSGCYWERLSGFSGELRDIEANDLLNGATVVDINAGDQGFYSDDCGTWTKLN